MILDDFRCRQWSWILLTTWKRLSTYMMHLKDQQYHWLTEWVQPHLRNTLPPSKLEFSFLPKYILWYQVGDRFYFWQNKDFFRLHLKTLYVQISASLLFLRLQLVFCFQLTQVFLQTFGIVRKMEKTEKKLNGCWWLHREFSGSGELFIVGDFFMSFCFRRFGKKFYIWVSSWVFSIFGEWHIKAGPKSKMGVKKQEKAILNLE